MRGIGEGERRACHLRPMSNWERPSPGCVRRSRWLAADVVVFSLAGVELPHPMAADLRPPGPARQGLACSVGREGCLLRARAGGG